MKPILFALILTLLIALGMKLYVAWEIRNTPIPDVHIGSLEYK